MIFERLEDWIGPAHLEDAAVAAAARRMARSPARMVVLDDFLVPQRLADLQGVVREAGRLEPVYALAAHGGERVSAEAWHASPPEQRFYNHMEVLGPRPGHELSRAYLAHVRFQDVMATAPFIDYFSRIVGERLDGVARIIGKALGGQHFLRPHSDAEPGRRLCGVLYLSEGWREAYGGRFLLYRNGAQADAIDPIANRLLLFIPNTDYLHAVAPVTTAAGEWMRGNYTFWFKGPPPRDTG